MAITKLITGSITDETITSTKIDDGAITNAKINASAGIDISKTVFTGAQPTISALSISQKDPDVSSNVTITGTNFESIPIVQFLNTTTGARITSATVTYTSSTSITAVFPASQTAGIYKVIVENPTGLSVISTATIINSAAPNWVTNASLGSVEEGDTVNIQLLAYDDDSSAVSSYSLQSGSLPSGVTLSGDSTVGALTGTAPTVSADTAFNFTIRATDDESQTTDKAFSLTVADYNIGNSVMFNDNDSPILSKTISQAPTSTKKFTFSFWFKRANILGAFTVCGLRFNNGSDTGIAFYIRSDEHLQFASNVFDVRPNGLFRDPSAWYHVVGAVDTTQATAADRVKIYVNGSEQGYSFTTYPSLNDDVTLALNNGNTYYIGGDGQSSDKYFDGYFGEMIYVDGQQLTSSSFGETNSNGVWIPKKYTGTYGNNGFALEFDDSSDFGKDTSGNGNHWTSSNLASTDQSQDSPHLNYATLNSLDISNGVLSEGNLKYVGNNNHAATKSTFGVSSGKWYWEVKCDAETSDPAIGIMRDDAVTSDQLNATNSTWYRANGQKVIDSTGSSYGDTWTAGDTISVALDMDNGFIYFGKNGTWQNSGVPTSGATGTGAADSGLDDGNDWLPAVKLYGTGDAMFSNFGSPIHSISSGNSDGDGYGNFEYAVPTGFYALNSKNLATYG